MRTEKNIQVKVYRGEAVSNGALSAPELPTRLKVLPWGESESTKGRVVVGLETLSALPAMQRTLGFERVALDWEHGTVPGTTAYKESAEPRSVAAYGTVCVVEGEGLFLDNLVWTPEGKAKAMNFEDLSPAVKQNKAGEVLFCHSVALTRHGAIYDLQFFSVSAPVQNEQKEDPEMKEEMLKLLGLTPEATPEEIAAAIEKMAALLKMLASLTPEAVTAMSALSAADVTQKLTVLSAVSDSGTATISDLVRKVGSIESQLLTFSAEKSASERGALQSRAAREGKVIPLSAEQIAAMDLIVLSSLVEKLPVTVPMDQRTVPSVVMHSAETDNAVMRAEIAKNCGLKVEDMNG